MRLVQTSELGRDGIFTELSLASCLVKGTLFEYGLEIIS